VIWCCWLFFICFFNEFSNIFHNWHYFSVSESIDSFSRRAFVEFHSIETHSRFEFIVNKKRKYLSDRRNESIWDIFRHRQSICLVVLLMIDVSAQISLHLLIENFALFVCLWVKCCMTERFYQPSRLVITWPNRDSVMSRDSHLYI
jgi:hypothetical protein